MKRNAAFFIVAVLAASLGGCSSMMPSDGVAEQVDDRTIASGVKTAILGDPLLSAAEIDVEALKGVVQLSGYVASRKEETKAVELAHGIKGVKAVRNEIRLK